MPQTCCVLGCFNRSGRDKVSFFKYVGTNSNFRHHHQYIQFYSVTILLPNNFLYRFPLALKSNFLEETNKCFEDTDIDSRPHKINIINLVSRVYLNIRLYSYSKILNSSILKASVNKRQKLCKTILFNNL